MSKHTPGPWTVAQDLVDDGDINVTTIEFPSAGYGIALIDVREDPADLDSPPREQALANSRLIAAAPDLLEALRAQEWSKGHFAEACGLTSAPCPDFCVMARAAIAKAEGK